MTLMPYIQSFIGKFDDNFANSFSNSMYLVYQIVRYYWGNNLPTKPSAVVGGIPFGTVAELSHAISDRIVRYRARGGVFLAHQDGGNESLRIVGRAWGPNRFLFLNMLETLFVYGASRNKDVMGEENFSDIDFLTQEIINESPWVEFEQDIHSMKDQGIEESHLTFPIVTKNRVYFSMYIETFEYRRIMGEYGQEMIEYTIFFRKFDGVPKYEYKTLLVPDARSDTGMRAIKAYRMNDPQESRMLNAISVLELTTSFFIDDVFVFDSLVDEGIVDEKITLPSRVLEAFA